MPRFSFQVAGERYVYKFVCDPEALFSMAFPDNQRPNLKADPDCLPGADDDTLPLVHYDEGASYLVDGGEQCVAGMPFPDGGYVYWVWTVDLPETHLSLLPRPLLNCCPLPD